MVYSYAGYYQIRRYGINAEYATSIANAATSTNEVSASERAMIMDIAIDVTQALNHYMLLDQYADYMPFNATRYYDARQVGNSTPDHISADKRALYLDAPLASLTAVTLGDDTSITIANDILQLPKERTPITQLSLLNSVALWTQYTTNWRQSIEITGVWCNRRQYSTEGWIDSGDTVQDNPLSASATTITVNDTNGNDSRNYAPRFDTGQLIRIESEYCIITDVDYTANTIEVVRGARGTTAASHVQTTQIDVFQVEPNIMRACSIATAFEYARKGKFEAVELFGGGTSVQVQPEIWPARVFSLLPKIAYIGSV